MSSGPASASSSVHLEFPPGFTWGAATAAYQIEGAWNVGQKGESIWDRFCHTPGLIKDGTTGDVACDHYHRFAEDFDLAKEIGLQGYRFSLSWPRVQPRGAGAPNRHGLDFYDRLVDAMLQRGIKPCATLYHWDLPQALQNRGGWANRDTCERFRDYAAVMFEQLGDRVTQWVTHNEPRVVTFTGHWLGVIAPGHRDFGEALQVAHHLLLSHGYAVQAFRQAGRPGEIGICQAILPRYPADPASTADAAAARRENEAYNGWFCDPVLDGRYPAELWRWYEAKGITMPEMGPDDLKIIAAPTDFLGINYYTCLHVRHDKTAWPLEGAYVPQGRDRIETGGEIWPEKLQDTLLQFHARYPSLKLRILENGACVKDVVNRFGQVEDEARIDYIHRHLVAIHGAISAGVKIDAYYVWSLMDNFEWSHGHAIRFGLIHVDYPTQQRRVKASGRWYGDVIRHNGVGRF